MHAPTLRTKKERQLGKKKSWTHEQSTVQAKFFFTAIFLATLYNITSIRLKFFSPIRFRDAQNNEGRVKSNGR